MFNSFYTFIMEVYEVLSDSSDELDSILPFYERVARLKSSENDQVPRKVVSPKKAVIHGISDSDESDSQEADVVVDKEWAAPSSSVSSYLASSSVKNTHSISSDDDLPDIVFGQKYVETMQDGKVLRDILELDSFPGMNKIFNERDETASKKTEKSRKKLKNCNSKEIEKEQKNQMREEKKRQKELEKALKESEKEIRNCLKPTECIKTMKVVIDQNLLQRPESQQIFNILDSNNIKHGIEENIVTNSVVWYRTVSNICIDNNQVVKEEREDPANVIVLVFTNEEFLKMIHSSTQKSKGKNTNNLSLDEFIVNIKSLHSEMDVTCITVGFEKFMRNVKESSGDLKLMAKQVHKEAIEQAIIELQLQTFINFHFLDNTVELGNLLYQFTKAVAEAPLRRQKQEQKSSVFSWYADMDSNCPVKLEKDSSSFIKLWRQQIQQFQNVGPEVAEAIAARYPSHRLLLKAYKNCSLKEAETLLQDIVVRRNYGPFGTQKRIGPELSYKMHLFFTSRNGSQLLKR